MRLEVYPGTMLLVEMDSNSRFNQQIGIYALIIIEDVNAEDEFVSFSYVLSDDFDEDSINFVDKPVNHGDGDNGGSGFGGDLSKSNYFNEFKMGQCVDLGIDAFNPADGSFDPQRAIFGCNPSAADIVVVSDSIEIMQLSTTEGRAHAVHSLVLNVPGGVDRSLVNIYDLYRMESAFHPSALVSDNSTNTMITLRTNINVEFFQNNCQMYLPYENRTFVAREAANGNDFLFSINSYANMRHFTGPDMTTPLEPASNVEECVNRIRMFTNLETKMWNFQNPESMAGFDALTVRGDFNNTGKVHLLADFATMADIVNSQDPDMFEVQTAINSVSSIKVRTRMDLQPWELPFEVYTDNDAYEAWNFGASIEISDLSTGEAFFFRSETMFTGGGVEISTENAWVNLGPLFGEPNYNDPAGTAAGGTNDPNQEMGALAIYFGPDGYRPFSNLDVVEIRASIPLSRLSTYFDLSDVSISGNSGGDGGPGQGENPHFESVGFVPSSDALDIGMGVERPSASQGIVKYVVFPDNAMFHVGRVEMSSEVDGSTFEFFENPQTAEVSTSGTYLYDDTSKALNFTILMDLGDDMDPFTWYKKMAISGLNGEGTIGTVFAEPTDMADRAELIFVFDTVEAAQTFQAQDLATICSTYQFGCISGENGGDPVARFEEAMFDPATDAVDILFGTDRPSESLATVKYVVFPNDASFILGRAELSSGSEGSTYKLFDS
ncbi:hypothetical protein MJH12_01220, partial [bacterium]|nr:hypothetical protein [bacterium]